MKENTSFLGSRTWKKFVNVAYNLGASVVIIGAMFKILHLPYGDLIIGIGMLSEAILFAITAIDPIGYDYHWEKVFPALVGGDKSQDTAAVIPISDNNIEHIIRTLRGFLEGFVLLVNNNAFGNPISIKESFDLSLDIIFNGMKSLEGVE